MGQSKDFVLKRIRNAQMLQMGWLHGPTARKEMFSSAQIVQVILDWIGSREAVGTVADIVLFMEGTKIGAVGFKEFVVEEVPSGA